MATSSNYFNNKGHLTPLAIRLYAKAVLEEKLERLPEEVYEHGSTCLECSEHILEVLEE